MSKYQICVKYLIPSKISFVRCKFVFVSNISKILVDLHGLLQKLFQRNILLHLLGGLWDDNVSDSKFRFTIKVCHPEVFYLHLFLKERPRREIHIVSLKQAYEEWKIGTGYVSIGKQVQFSKKYTASKTNERLWHFIFETVLPAWSLRGSSSQSNQKRRSTRRRTTVKPVTLSKMNSPFDMYKPNHQYTHLRTPNFS